MITYPCECEHISHFDPTEDSPLGNPNHKYGIRFNAKLMEVVTTPYGTIEICLYRLRCGCILAIQPPASGPDGLERRQAQGTTIVIGPRSKAP